MMDVFDVLSARILEKANHLSEATATGNFENFEEYKKTCGEIRGLLIARGYVLGLKQEMEQKDD